MKKFIASLSIVVFAWASAIGSAQAANIGTLVDCDQSPAFTKRLNASVKKLESRLSKYEPGTPPALALEQQIERTKSRFKRYGESNLLCGTDGLPHLVTDGDLTHASEFIIPGVMFLYITGWIGWAGRRYIQTVASTKNPTEKEIILDVPLAIKIMLSAYFWPVLAWQEFVSGDFVVAQDDITISPR
uniref:Photosystem I reaction center subunit III n=1 Tax=Rhizochromulina marina TaxID=1034831 RepID=A0A514CQ15_9STRA|nr:photosystem I subunit F [Rhizochromulina marina]QDH81908.1 photosystem I subunit F [Rhizochromulina marina]